MKYFHKLLTTLSQIILKKQSKLKMADRFAPPALVKGRTILRPEEFVTSFEVPYLSVDTQSIDSLISSTRKYLLKVRNFQSVQKLDGHTVIFFDPSIIEKLNDPECDLSIKEYKKEIRKRMVTFYYDNWNTDQLLKAVIPDDIDIPSSYTKVGHIIHLNLRDNQLPFKKIIGQIYLDTIPHARTVVNKLNNIANEYRIFPMEILAGENKTVTVLRENNYTFRLDFAKVYWNSRLSTEHSRLLNYMRKNDVLYDVFCGVGPFAIPAAKRGVIVMANDLNPESIKWLKENMKINGVTNNIDCFNKDGREFLRNDVKNDLLHRRKNNINGTEHIAMNLPAVAHEFLDVFLHDWLSDEEIELIIDNPPLVHLYCFVKVKKDDDPLLAAKKLVENTINCELTDDFVRAINYVRNVAPTKDMIRVSFYLTEKILRLGQPNKKIKLDNVVDCDISDNNGEKQETSAEKPANKIGKKGSVMKTKVSKKSGNNKKVNLDKIKNINKQQIQKVDNQMKDLRNIVVSGSKAIKPKKIAIPNQIKTTIKPIIHAEAQENILRRLKNL